MRTRLKLKPGQKGTKKLMQEYGDKLICVRYRYDLAEKKRYKTVELIVDEVDWQPKINGPIRYNKIVGVKIYSHETVLWQLIKKAGGRWDRSKKLCLLKYAEVVKLGLQDRIVS
jgi:hypothetical protein